MPDPLRPLRINAVELLRQPGAVRDVTLDIAAAPLEAEHERLVGDLHVELRLTARNDSIDVDGTVSADWATVCRRCLRDVSGTAVGVVDERYQIEPLDPDAYLIEDGQLDLVPMVPRVDAAGTRQRTSVPRRLRRAVPGLRRRSQHHRLFVRHHGRDDRWAALGGFVPDDD